MFQVNYAYGNTAHLPYTVAALCAYAFDDPDLRAEYTLKDIIFLREDPDGILPRIQDPDVIGFSSYVWNFEFNKVTARRIKELYPDCMIIFGGHHVEPGGRLLEECPFVDFLIHGEGEEAFRQMLRCAAGLASPENIHGVSYRRGNEIVTNPVRISKDEYIDYTSPYLGGYFDRILAEHPKTDFMALIETTRGCPNSCAYCDWSNMRSRIRKFPLERILSEISWISEHHILGLGSADSNFGVFERDEQITDHIIQQHLKTGFPIGFQTSYAKNSNERIFRIGCALEKHRLSKGITLSFQSMSQTALDNIGRRNIPLSNYRELMDMYNKAGISTYTELILGLPGETPDSFKNGINTLLDLGQHNSIYIHNCEWLPCSVMGSPEYVEKYGIETAKIPLNQPHIEQDVRDGITEYSHLVVSTYSMTREDWMRMNLFSFTVQALHHMGVAQLFALYLRREKHVSYLDFYERLTQFVFKESRCLRPYAATITERLERIAGGDESAEFTVTDPRFGSVQWPMEEYLFLCCAFQNEEFYREIRPLIQSFGVDEQLLDELMRFQSVMLKRPYFEGGEYEFGYDFADYFAALIKNKDAELKSGRYHIEIKTRPFTDPGTYAKVVAWYGRKDNSSLYFLSNEARPSDNQ